MLRITEVRSTFAKGIAHTRYIVVRGPKVHIGGIEKTQERETPGNAINNHLFPFRGELIDDGAQQEKVD